MVWREKTDSNGVDTWLYTTPPHELPKGFHEVDKSPEELTRWRNEINSLAKDNHLAQKALGLFDLTAEENRYVEYSSKAHPPLRDLLHTSIVGTLATDSLRKIGLETESLEGIQLMVRVFYSKELSDIILGGSEELAEIFRDDPLPGTSPTFWLGFNHPDSDRSFQLYIKHNDVGEELVSPLSKGDPLIGDTLDEVVKGVRQYILQSGSSQ